MKLRCKKCKEILDEDKLKFSLRINATSKAIETIILCPNCKTPLGQKLINIPLDLLEDVDVVE